MTQMKLRLPFQKRPRIRRTTRVTEDPGAVFRTFVHVLAQMRLHARGAPLHHAQPEKG